MRGERKLGGGATARLPKKVFGVKLLINSHPKVTPEPLYHSGGSGLNKSGDNTEQIWSMIGAKKEKNVLALPVAPKSVDFQGKMIIFLSEKFCGRGGSDFLDFCLVTNLHPNQPTAYCSLCLSASALSIHRHHIPLCLSLA